MNDAATTLTTAAFSRVLRWSIAALALAIAPHVPHLAPWTVLLAGSAALLRLWIDAKGRELPAKWLRIVVAFAALLGVLHSYRTLNGIEAGTALLVVMAGMKLLETRNNRDLTVIIFLAYFALFAAFLYDQRILLLPYLLACTWLLTTTLMRIHHSQMPGMRTAGVHSGKMLLQALPLAALLFLLVPRLPGQFWSVPAREQAITGLSEEMTPGDVSELSLSSAVAFRAHFEGELPPPRERYWRGPVLQQFDGRTWRRLAMPQPRQAIVAQGPHYDYRITLEPQERNWIFALDMATDWDEDRAARSADLLLSARQPRISVLTSFQLRSATRYRTGEELSPVMRQITTFIPSSNNQRTQALARQMRAQSPDDASFIQNVLRLFNTSDFYYTLQPPALADNAVDDFMFNTRRGFCEHYASAFTVMMRAAGIPARVVTGYQGGEYNPLGDYLIVRQSDAHAWTEVWETGRGWRRVDPTAAIAPDRIERGLQAAMGANEPVPGRMVGNHALLSQLRLAWDAANTFWNNQVVQFGADQQRWLLRQLNLDDERWEYLGVGLGLALAAFFGALSLYLAWQFRSAPPPPARAAFAKLSRRFAAIDLARQDQEGPRDYITRLARARPELASRLQQIGALYIALEYQAVAPPDTLQKLQRAIRQLPLGRAARRVQQSPEQ